MQLSINELHEGRDCHILDDRVFFDPLTILNIFKGSQLFVPFIGAYNHVDPVGPNLERVHIALRGSQCAGTIPSLKLNFVLEHHCWARFIEQDRAMM